MTAPTVKVKLLEWDSHPDADCCPSCNEHYGGGQNNLAGVNEYNILPHPCAVGLFVLDIMGNRCEEDFTSVEAAKAAAQADYEARILSAIDTINLEAHIGAVLEEAARMVDCACEPHRKVAVLSFPPNSAQRWNACGQANCGAMAADDIRALRPDALQALERHVAAELAKRELLFTDTSPETKWTADCEVACPCCGGSGHKDDALQALERVRREARVEGMRAALDIVAAHGWAQQVYEELFDAIEAEERGEGE